MKSISKPAFWKAYAALPSDIPRRTVRVYRLWREDPSHPGLEFKRVSSSKPIYSVRIDGHRTVGTLDRDTMTWLWIGKHDEYERLLTRLG
jgi:hypothetical protein